MISLIGTIDSLALSMTIGIIVDVQMTLCYDGGGWIKQSRL
jgi:hypothetical protein